MGTPGWLGAGVAATDGVASDASAVGVGVAGGVGVAAVIANCVVAVVPW
jgi:hypothetical protein